MRSLLLLALLAATPAAGQTVIDAGMPKAQVLTTLGKPVVERTTGDATFLFYTNGCERTCGMHDVVVLDKDVVVDAVFRSPKRHFSGTSSSPRMIPAEEARRGRGAEPRPVSAKSAPKVLKAKPMAAKPAPAAAKPAPAVATPTPTAAKPVPPAAKPAPVVAKPVPAATPPAPVAPAKAAPVAAKPEVSTPKKPASATEKPAAEAPITIHLKTTKPPTAL